MALGDGDEDGACDSVALRARACRRAKRAARSHPGSPRRRRRSPVLPATADPPLPGQTSGQAAGSHAPAGGAPRPPLHAVWGPPAPAPGSMENREHSLGRVSGLADDVARGPR